MGNCGYFFPRSHTIRVQCKIISCCTYGYKDTYWTDHPEHRLAVARVDKSIEAWRDANEAPDYFVSPESLKDLRKKVKEQGFAILYDSAGLVAFDDCFFMFFLIFENHQRAYY